MGKFGDKLVFSIVIIFIVFVWSYYFTSNYLISVLISILSFIIIRIFLVFIKSRRKSLKNMNTIEMCKTFAFLGINESTKIFSALIPSENLMSIDPPYIVAMVSNINTLIHINFKFSKTNEDDIAKAYRKAKKEKVDRVIVLSSMTDRNILVFSKSLDIKFEFPNSRQVRKFLINANALPNSIFSYGSIQKIKNQFSFKDILNSVFSRHRIKYYFFSGTMLLVMSFFAPIKLYYIIMGSFLLVLAAISSMSLFFSRY
ncbi:MAG: hypothetical protein LBU04_00520 [Christensenellaceae bacterium]|jgi:hypothetical protein|nr:hypothetical protein [Christensenellaceae bacterium]